jgi:dipeptidyl-peptidase-3
MAIGYICPCCGVHGERPEAAAEALDDAVLFMCVPCGEMPKAPAPDMSVHTIPADTPVVELEATKAFGMLTPKEQSYAHALGRADWEGAKICLLQCSAESAPIFSLLQLVFSAQPVAELSAAATAAGLSDGELAQALMYCAAFYGNVGNYKSFGDTKFVPELPAERFQLLLTAGKADAAKVEALWTECCARMYSLPPRQRQMGLGAANGISTYFSANCDESDAELGNKFLDSIGLSAYNTRLFKDAAGKYTVRIASSACEPADDPVGQLCKEHIFEGKSFLVSRGDYSPLMARVAAAISDALPHVANENQEAMLQHYVTSFTQGSIDAHKDASRSWIRDIGPSVESYIGFIESYRDPSGVRGEWEGFVSCVNKEVSAKFQ